MAPRDLLSNPANPRTHPGAQMDTLRGSLDELGWLKPILVNKRTGYIVDGHARAQAALQQGVVSIPVAYIDLSEEEEKLALATLDPIAAMAGKDDAAMTALIATIQTDNSALQALLDGLPSSPSKRDGPKIEEVDLSEVRDRFWLSVHGPLPQQMDALERLRAAMEELGPEIQVEVGTTKT